VVAVKAKCDTCGAEFMIELLDITAPLTPKGKVLCLVCGPKLVSTVIEAKDPYEKLPEIEELDADGFVVDVKKRF
jgi:hypothetical protein